jgi:predicted nuclease of restriction endonuclease-like (RecB) superfamily
MNDLSDHINFPIYDEILNLIKTSKHNLYTAVNTELVLLYWNIGKIIKEEIIKSDRAEYGKQIVDYVSKQLTLEFGRGFSRANLFRMIQFYETYTDKGIVSTLLRQLSWSHFLELIQIKDPLKRDFYTKMCVSEGWSVRTLKGRINSILFERTAISRKPEETIKNDLDLLEKENKMSVDLFFRDPYVLDFLNLKDTYSEKDIENAILAELEKFILEMGTNFAFLARQKRIVIDNEDYYIDLLFYHRKMKRLVVIELKLDKFKAADKGQIELYLRWLEKYEMNDGEESPLGIILCAEKSNESIELLQLDKSGIHVAQYLTELPPKEMFEKKLQDAVAKAKFQLEKAKEYE